MTERYCCLLNALKMFLSPRLVTSYISAQINVKHYYFFVHGFVCVVYFCIGVSMCFRWLVNLSRLGLQNIGCVITIILLT